MNNLTNPASHPATYLTLPQVTQESESHCGPATLQILFGFLDRRMTQDQIVNAADVAERIEEHGTRPDQLAKAVTKLAPDLQFWFKQYTTVEDLIQLIKVHKWPVAINWQGLFYDSFEEEQANNPNGEYGHYSVVIDIDPAKDEIVIADPYHEYSAAPRVFSLEWFLTRWWDVDKDIDPDTGKESCIHTHKLIFIIAPKDAEFPKELGMHLPEQLSQLEE